MEITTTRKIASSSLVQKIKLPDTTTFYSYNTSNGLFSTVFMIDDCVAARYKIDTISDSEKFVMPNGKLLVVLRNLKEPIEVNAVDTPPQLDVMYLSLCENSDLDNPRECRIVGQFFGHSFKVLRVSKQDLYTGERHFMISSEYLSPKNTFKSQKNIDRDPRVHIVSDFITRDEFIKFQDQVVNEIAVI